MKFPDGHRSPTRASLERASLSISNLLVFSSVDKAESPVDNGRGSPEDIQRKPGDPREPATQVFPLQRKGNRQAQEEGKKGGSKGKAKRTHDRICNASSLAEIVTSFGNPDEHGEAQG